MPSAKAIGALIGTALHPFLVTNSKNLFVYREKNGKVFYLKMSDHTSPSSPAPASYSVPLTPSTLKSAWNSLQVNLKSHPETSSQNQPASPATSGSADGKMHEQICLEVFGLDPPGAEITVQLRQLLEGKLASITLSIISTLLERNPQMKLTPEDIDFIKGNTSFD